MPYPVINLFLDSYLKVVWDNCQQKFGGLTARWKRFCDAKMSQTETSPLIHKNLHENSRWLKLLGVILVGDWMIDAI